LLSACGLSVPVGALGRIEAPVSAAKNPVPGARFGQIVGAGDPANHPQNWKLVLTRFLPVRPFDQCPLLALGGHSNGANHCPLSGIKRTSLSSRNVRLAQSRPQWSLLNLAAAPFEVIYFDQTFED
jgi:hypothetical protein